VKDSFSSSRHWSLWATLGVAVLAALATVLQISSTVQLQTVAQAAQSMESQSVVSLRPDIRSAVGELHRSAAQAADGWWANPEAKFSLGRASLVLARYRDGMDAKTSLICQALQNFRSAARANPANSIYQLGWSDLRGQLRSPETLCPGMLPADDPLSAAERLNLGLSLAPNGTREMYLAGLILLSMGEKNTALDLFRKNQELNPYFSSVQRDFILGLVWSESDLVQAIPRKFPESVAWVQHFENERSADLREWRGTFEKALDDTVSELIARADGNESAVQYLKQIAQLQIVGTSDALRKRLDSLLATVYQNESQSGWAALLDKRAKLDRLPVIKSVIVDDRSPKSTMLFSWTTDSDERSLALDALGRTIGVMLPEKGRASTLILEDLPGGARLDAGDVELLFSQDNEAYFSLPAKPEHQSFFVDGRQTIVINLSGIDARFFKIRYSGSAPRGTFTNSLQRLVQVYGHGIP